MTWEIMLGIIALFGFLTAVMTPIVKLNTSITKLNLALETLQAQMKKMDEDNMDSHKRIWSYNDGQDALLNNHEKRISGVENTLKFIEKMHPEIGGFTINEQSPKPPSKTEMMR